MLNGQGVAADNAFAWLPGLIAAITEQFEKVRSVGVAVWDEIARTWDTLKGVGEGIIGVIDGIAKAMGLGDWKTLGIILVVGQLTGAFRLLSSLTGITAGIVGAPVALVAAIMAAIVAVIALLVVFQGDIGKIFAFLWDVIKWPFERLWDLVKWIFGGIGDLFVGLWNGIAAGAGMAWDAIKAAFAPVGAFFGGIVDGAVGLWTGFWELIFAGAEALWTGITGIFGGLVDFFSDPIGRVGDMFKGLWDGILSGAAGAWEGVKNFFGFGGGQQEGSLPSYDVGTARVPGADGQPMRALIHGGERILTVDQNKRFGALIDSSVDMTTLPMTPFAMGPTAVPAGAGAVGSSMNARFDLNGRSYGLNGPSSTLRDLRSGMRRAARMATGPSPRWRTT